MSKGEFLCLDGVYFKSGEKIFSSENRSFKFGDGLFETIRIINGVPQLLELHRARLEKAMETLKLNDTGGKVQTAFERGVKNLLEKNNLTESDARLRLSVFRESGGKGYLPFSGDTSVLMEAYRLETSGYTLNQKGLTVDVFPELKKTPSALSKFKSANAQLYILASIYAQDNGFDDCLILNPVDRIAEATSSNVFLVKNDEIYTPGFDSGCVNGVMRRKLLQVCKENQLPVTETQLCTEDLLEADEVFLSNAIQGIQWVGAFRNKRYYNSYAKRLVELLNDR